jgi:hypothetical protein
MLRYNIYKKMVMFPAELSIQEFQRKKLMKGQGILLKPHQLVGPHKIILDKKLHTKLDKAKKNKKGMKIKLSPELLMGNGFWDSLKDTAMEKGKDLAKDLIKKGADVAVNYTAGKVKDLANQQVDKMMGTTVGLGIGASQQLHANHHIRAKLGSGFRPAGY